MSGGSLRIAEPSGPSCSLEENPPLGGTPKQGELKRGSHFHCPLRRSFEQNAARSEQAVGNSLHFGHSPYMPFLFCVSVNLRPLENLFQPMFLQISPFWGMLTTMLDLGSFQRLPEGCHFQLSRSLCGALHCKTSPCLGGHEHPLLPWFTGKVSKWGSDARDVPCVEIGSFWSYLVLCYVTMCSFILGHPLTLKSSSWPVKSF